MQIHTGLPNIHIFLQTCLHIFWIHHICFLDVFGTHYGSALIPNRQALLRDPGDSTTTGAGTSFCGADSRYKLTGPRCPAPHRPCAFAQPLPQAFSIRLQITIQTRALLSKSNWSFSTFPPLFQSNQTIIRLTGNLLQHGVDSRILTGPERFPLVHSTRRFSIDNTHSSVRVFSGQILERRGILCNNDCPFAQINTPVLQERRNLTLHFVDSIQTLRPHTDQGAEVYKLFNRCAPAQVDLSTQAVCDCVRDCDALPQLSLTFRQIAEPIETNPKWISHHWPCICLIAFLLCLIPHLSIGNIARKLIPHIIRSHRPQTSCTQKWRLPLQSGPKSGQSWRRNSRTLLALLIICQFCSANRMYLHSSGGEGCLAGSCGETEATFSVQALESLLQANQHDKASPVGYGHHQCTSTLQHLNSIQKRSIKRAYTKACTVGSAWYKGRCMQAEDFPLSLRTRSNPSTVKPALKFKPDLAYPKRAPRYRMQIAHINVGGLSTDRLAEIKLWAIQNELDVLVLTETRWSFQSEWEDVCWTHIHTGTSPDRADGILFVINKRTCAGDHIGFAEILPGRIGHLRLHFRKRALDIVGCYQHVDTKQTSRQQSRSHYWDQLDEFLHSLPKRNSFLMCGDLNCSLQKDGIHVGQDHFTWQQQRRTGSVHQDMHRLHAILHTHMLQAVNTWSAKHPPTYVYGTQASRIDHFLMRCAESDSMARDIKFFPQAGFLPINGAFHIPMTCSIRKIPYHKEKAPHISSCTYQQRLHCRAAWKDQTPHWLHFEDEMESIWTDFAKAPVHDEQIIDHMHQALRPCFQNHFPKCQPQDFALSTEQLDTFKSKWFHKRQLQTIQPQTLRAIFQIWHHTCRFQVLKRQQQRIARTRKRQQLHDLMIEANTAANRHDNFTLYQAVQRLAPKQTKRRIRLRTSTGTIANSEEVLKLTEAHIKEVWAGPVCVRYDCTTPPGVPFTCEELASELSQIPVVKSVAKPFLPGLCWKVRARATAEFLYGLLEKWWNQTPIFIPQQWKQAWLIFIPKPHKSADRLTHLRPLALLEPIGKCVLGLLTKCLAEQLRPKIAAWPQFAFCANRSALDAIRRVTAN